MQRKNILLQYTNGNAAILETDDVEKRKTERRVAERSSIMKETSEMNFSLCYIQWCKHGMLSLFLCPIYD